MKSTIVDIFNHGNENYFKIKIIDSKSTKYIEKLTNMITALQDQNYLESEPEVLSTKYYKWIGRHEFYKTNKYIIYIIYEKDYLHLVVKCSLKRRQQLIKIINQFFN